MASKLFISAKEVAKELEVSDSYAYRLIRQLNAELEQKGFVVYTYSNNVGDIKCICRRKKL